MQKTLKTILFISSLSIFSSTLLASAFASQADSATEFQAKEPKIVGGVKAAFGEWPAMVALLNVNTIKKVEAGIVRYPNGRLVPKSHANLIAQFCGASLIDKKWVLTAAHCLIENGVTTKAKDINVLVGASDLIGEGRRISVKKVIVHPKFDQIIGDNDLALLELDTPAPTKIHPMKVLYRDMPAGTLAMVIGFGAISKNATKFPSELYEVELPLVDRKICEAIYNQNGKIEFTENMICAGYSQGGKDTCKGDSGGPLMARTDGYYQQIGITSWGISCAEPGLYGAYTRLSRYKDWIASNTKDSSESGGGSVFFLLFPLLLLNVIRKSVIGKKCNSQSIN